MAHRRGTSRGWATLTLLIALGVAGGCNVAGYVADVVAGGESPPIHVESEYHSLANKSVAVIVNADMPVLYEFPQVQLEIAAAVNEKLADGVKGIQLVRARDVVEYQQRNIYWNTATPRELMAALDVERLVWIDVIEFRTNEPGNSIMYRGVISARVNVHEADADKPNDPAYGTIVSAAYPPDRPEGVPEADPMAIRKGALDMFSWATAGKFFDHEQPRGG